MLLRIREVAHILSLWVDISSLILSQINYFPVGFPGGSDSKVSACNVMVFEGEAFGK